MLSRLLREWWSRLLPARVDAAASARYAAERMAGARDLAGRAELLDFALAQCTVQGLVLEFGVFRGDSLQMIAKRCAQEVHGFDSFEGLPEDWTGGREKGRFSLGGGLPPIKAPNVVLHKGWFDQTLPGFLAAHPGPVRFLHVDCDIYSSTRTVLQGLGPRLVAGTILVFDEYFNYPGWHEHEFLAFAEFVQRHHIAYSYIGYASAHESVAVRIDTVAGGAGAC
ncbi:MAG: class I SAM-dependent methyltransferase [Betaproteobacteria bacterium]|nr:class I SAM-dependent methyltransferase [Betaproteobacteria bacterium]